MQVEIKRKAGVAILTSEKKKGFTDAHKRQRKILHNDQRINPGRKI